MKKILFSFALLASLAACRDNQKNGETPTPSVSGDFKPAMTLAEANKLGIYDDSSQDIEEDINVDVPKVLDLNTRSATIGITAVTSGAIYYTTGDNAEGDGYGNYPCGNPKYENTPRFGKEFQIIVKGTGFGTAQEQTTVKLEINKSVYNVTSFQNWRDTLIEFYINDCSPAISLTDLKVFNAKVIINKQNEIVTKTQKFISDYFDSTCDIPYSVTQCFGQAFWLVANERKRMNKVPLGFTPTRNLNGQQGFDGFTRPVSYSYVPQVGDMLHRAPQADNYACINESIPSLRCDFKWEVLPPRDAGIVMAVSEPVNNVRTVTVWEMNMKCTGTISKKKYKYTLVCFCQKKANILGTVTLVNFLT